MIRATLAAAMLAPMLAGCVVVDDRPDTLAEFAIRSAELNDRRQGLLPTSGANLPTSGSANYDGVMNLTMPDGSFGVYSVVGNLDLDVGFSGAGSVTGTADGFIESSGDRFAGSLDIGDGFIIGNQSGAASVHFEARMTGSLNDGRRDIGITRRLDGNFYGSNAEMVSGVLRENGPVQFYGGSFIAEQ